MQPPFFQRSALCCMILIIHLLYVTGLSWAEFMGVWKKMERTMWIIRGLDSWS